MSNATNLSDKSEASWREECAYGKPPMATRFKKGRSGNPTDGPRSRLTYALSSSGSFSVLCMSGRVAKCRR